MSSQLLAKISPGKRPVAPPHENMLDRLVVIIGGMRCGTTSLFTWLSQHPQVCACIDKEPAFFSNDSVWNNGLDWYRSLWESDSARHRVALEASTNYSKVAIFPRTAERLRTTAPNAHLIYLMRDPIGRLESHYTLGRAKGWRDSKQSLNRGVHADLIECSRYAKQIDQFRDYLDAGRMLLVLFEDLKDAPAATLDHVCRFCGIDDSYDYCGLDLAHNTNSGRRPGELGQILYRARRWLPFWHSLSRHISPTERDRIRRIFNRQHSHNVRLPDPQRRFVLGELESDLKRLRDEYGVDTSSWNLE